MTKKFPEKVIVEHLNVIRQPDNFCFDCGLYKKCKTPIMNGEGSEHPTWLFIGEAPGGDEDEKGIPFWGKSGMLLRDSIEKAGIDLQKCRFSNVIRCRPPNNSLKEWPDAMELCRVHILREIRATRPKVVVLVGATALKSIMNKTGILRLHGEVLDAGLYKIVCMFHPSYLLRDFTAGNQTKFMEALKTARRLGDGTVKREKKRNHTVILDRKMKQEFVDIIKKTEYPATDVEGSTLSPFSSQRKAELGCVSIAFGEDDACCFPVNARKGLEGCKLSVEESLEAIKECWEYPGLKWLTHHGKYDYSYPRVLHGIYLGGKGHATAGIYFDGMLGSYALDERKGIHGLKQWSARLGMAGYDQKLRQYALDHPEADAENGGNMLLVPIDILYPYNMDDSIATLREFYYQRKKLKAEGLWKRPLMFPLLQINTVAAMMEIEGVNLDLRQNAKLNEKFTKQIDKIDQKLLSYPEIKQLQDELDEKVLESTYERVLAYKKPVANIKKKVLELYKRKELNLNSPDTKRKLLFEVLGYESLMLTESGLPSAERWILEELFKKHKNPVVGKIISRGELQSAKDKYITPIPSWAGTDGRTHTSYLPHGTATGRVSSQDPNHENLPKRAQLAQQLRTQFISRGGDYYLVEEDSKQIELRLIADRAQDEVMIAEFNAGEDPHVMGAQAAYNYTPEQWAHLDKIVQKELRSYSKNAVSFGVVYGRSAEALALDFGWGVRKAQKFIDRYFAKYFGIRVYLKKRAKYIIKHLEVVSKFGRHRRLPEGNHEDKGRQAAAIREGINTDIQGDASDISWTSAYRMYRWLEKHEMKSKVIIVVHDAVYLDAYYKEMKIVIPKLHEFMTDRLFIETFTEWELGVPLDTDCSVGKNLGDMVELEHTKVPGQFIIPDQFQKPQSISSVA